jgi:ElaB/YqjD/DUF883 family membrane-anchored ribosome-binding protein
MKAIPEAIRNNPHILKRMNIYVPPSTVVVPRAALSNKEYRSSDLPPLDPCAQGLFDAKETPEETTVDELRNAVCQLRILQKDLVNRGDYEGARSACLGVKEAHRQLRERNSFDRDKVEVEAMISKRNELSALVETTSKEWDDRIESHASQTKEQLTTLDERNAKELAEFDQTIPDELPVLWRRNSVTYLQMRSKEYNLANTEHFGAAIALRKKADELQARERQAGFESMDMFFRQRRKRLLVHHESLFQSWGEFAVRQRDVLVHEREKAVSGHQNRIERLNKAIVVKCEQSGIKQKEINPNLVDEDRVALVKAQEDTNPFTYKRCVTAMIETRKSYPTVTDPRSRSRRSSTGAA